MIKKYKKAPTYLELVNELKIDAANPVGSLQALDKFWEENDKSFNQDNFIYFHSCAMQIFHDLLRIKVSNLEELRNRVKGVDDLLNTLHHCTVDKPKAIWENKLLSSYYVKIQLLARPKTPTV